VEHSLSWEVSSHSAGHRNPRHLWNPKVRYSVHKNRMNPFHTFRHCISSRWILILSFHICLVLASSLFPSGFPTRILRTFLISATHDTCPAHLICLRSITLIRWWFTFLILQKIRKNKCIVMLLPNPQASQHICSFGPRASRCLLRLMFSVAREAKCASCPWPLHGLQIDVHVTHL